MLAILMLIVLPAQAANNDGWVNITIGDANSEFNREGIVMAAYLIAEGEYGYWTMLPAFSDIRVFAREDGSSWINQSMNEIKQRIELYNISATQQATSDANGLVEFTNLEHGIYFVCALKIPDTRLTVNTMLLAVPNKEGSLQVRANAKSEFKPTPSPSPTPTPTPKPTPTPFLSPEPTPEPTPAPPPEPVDLTITYVYPDGTPVAPPHHEENLMPEDQFNVPSPVIPGYTPTYVTVTGTMPNHDLEVTVIYVPNGTNIINIDDYETALGLGNIQMHVGVCFE